CSSDLLEVVFQEVRDADARGEPASADALERAPGLDVAILLRRGPVDEVQVDVVEAQLLEALLDGAIGVAVPVVPQLRGDEQFVARNSGCRDRPPDALLVAVDRRGVDVAVADFESVADDALRLDRVNLEYAETELGDGLAVVESHMLHRPSLCPGVR